MALNKSVKYEVWDKTLNISIVFLGSEALPFEDSTFESSKVKWAYILFPKFGITFVRTFAFSNYIFCWNHWSLKSAPIPNFSKRKYFVSEFENF